MKAIKIHISLFFLLCFTFVNAQEEHQFKIGLNIKGFYPGIEVSIEHPISKKIQLESVWGINDFRYKNIQYSNTELLFRFHHFTKEEKKAWNYGPYLKIKHASFNKYADTSGFHDASILTNVVYYAGTGGFLAYRMFLGKKKHLVVEPFVGLGINIALVSDEINVLQIDFEKLYQDVEPDIHLGLGIAWMF